MPPKLKRLLQNFALLCGSIIVFLIFCEIALRITSDWGLQIGEDHFMRYVVLGAQRERAAEHKCRRAADQAQEGRA